MISFQCFLLEMCSLGSQCDVEQIFAFGKSFPFVNMSTLLERLILPLSSWRAQKCGAAAIMKPEIGSTRPNHDVPGPQRKNDHGQRCLINTMTWFTTKVRLKNWWLHVVLRTKNNEILCSVMIPLHKRFNWMQIYFTVSKWSPWFYTQFHSSI